MKLPNPLTRERLLQALRATPRRSTSELAKLLGVTAQSVRRLLGELHYGIVLSAGQTRRVRYALRRPLREAMKDLPLFAIDPDGQAAQLSSLALVQPQGTLLPLEGTAWPIPAESRDGWWAGLPYPIHAMRPAGYMGRQLARAEHQTLGVSDNPDDWNDDDILWVLSRRGSDVTGNLLLGNASYDTWIRNKVQDLAPLPDDATLPAAYAQLAERAVAAGGGGFSAAGEFPKFAAVRERAGAATPHVLVKFSGAAGGAAEQRWGDLLVCEHLALECARQLDGISAARTRVLMHGGRVFIEVERFDRVGLHGRISLCAMDAIHPSFLGDRENAWPSLVARLHRMGLVDAKSVTTVERLWFFGRLIANNDMHMGNLSFHVDHVLNLAPTYDMLPMAYAPLPGGEVAQRAFRQEFPLPNERESWLAACAAALTFWATAAEDTRISGPFRATCRTNLDALRGLRDRI